MTSNGSRRTHLAISRSPAGWLRSSSRLGACCGPSLRGRLRLASSALKRHIVRPMSKLLLAAFILISACLSGPARAQDAAAPFDGDLQRLAEILGTLHYLRGICGTNEGAKWRNQMQALIDAETPSGERRARMIAGFNRGYNGFQQTYRTCTPAASVAIRHYIEEGSKISRDLTARYAN